MMLFYSFLNRINQNNDALEILSIFTCRLSISLMIIKNLFKNLESNTYQPYVMTYLLKVSLLWAIRFVQEGSARK